MAVKYQSNNFASVMMILYILVVIILSFIVCSCDLLNVHAGKGNDTDGVEAADTAYKSAITVADALKNSGKCGVWVHGYIVGGDLAAKSVSFKPPFTSATNLAIAHSDTVRTRANCMAVQLPQGQLREDVNLIAHPEYQGAHIYLKGDVVISYFGLIGLKNTCDYVLDTTGLGIGPACAVKSKLAENTLNHQF